MPFLTVCDMRNHLSHVTQKQASPSMSLSYQMAGTSPAKLYKLVSMKAAECNFNSSQVKNWDPHCNESRFVEMIIPGYMRYQTLSCTSVWSPKHFGVWMEHVYVGVQSLYTVTANVPTLGIPIMAQSVSAVV